MNIQEIEGSIQLIMNSGIDYEFRSTILPKFHNEKTLLSMAKTIKGAQNWALQNFKNSSVLDSEYSKEKGFCLKEMNALKKVLGVYVEKIEVRG